MALARKWRRRWRCPNLCIYIDTPRAIWDVVCVCGLSLLYKTDIYIFWYILDTRLCRSASLCYYGCVTAKRKQRGLEVSGVASDWCRVWLALDLRSMNARWKSGYFCNIHILCTCSMRSHSHKSTWTLEYWWKSRLAVQLNDVSCANSWWTVRARGFLVSVSHGKWMRCDVSGRKNPFFNGNMPTIYSISCISEMTCSRMGFIKDVFIVSIKCSLPQVWDRETYRKTCAAVGHCGHPR